jgi:GNAT superfamily N-acetyltransferase
MNGFIRRRSPAFVAAVFALFALQLVASPLARAECPDPTASALDSFGNAVASAHQFAAVSACSQVIAETQEDIRQGVGNWDLKAYANEIKVCSCGIKSGASSTWTGVKALFKLDTYRGLLAMLEQPRDSIKKMGEALGDTMYAYQNDLDRVQAKAVRCAFWTELAGAIAGGKGTTAAIKQATQVARAALGARAAAAAAASAEAGATAGKVLESAEESGAAALGENLPLKAVVDESAGGHLRIQYLDPESGQRVAKVACMIDADKKLSIMSVKVEEGFRGQGISTRLYREILRSHPDILEIEGNLAEDNEAIYRKAIAEGKSHLEALKETPAYKVRAKLGFGLIDESQSVVDAKGQVDLVVRRGP